MIVVDTNVLSELMKPQGLRAEAVVKWLRALDLKSVYTTAVCVAEVLAGVAILPAGRRRAEIVSSAERIFDSVFSGRILPFDEAAAKTYATIVVARRKRGRSTDPVDLQIAAIARANGMTVATRNTGDFDDCGIDLINPWET